MSSKLTLETDFTLFEAIFSFSAQNNKMLTFKKGDILLSFTDHIDRHNWQFVFKEDGQSGYIPINYVKNINTNQETLSDFFTKCYKSLIRITRNDLTSKQIELLDIIEKYLPNHPDPNSEPLYKIVESVRKETKLSYSSSCTAVQVVLENLKNINAEDRSSSIITFLDILNSGLETPQEIDKTCDGQRLKLLFKKLKSCKNDFQQRNWAVHEDEHIISDYLKEVLSIAINADRNITKHVILNDLNLSINTLVEFYQMETRSSLRELFIQVFLSFTVFDKSIILALLNSILPMEIARELQFNVTNTNELCLCASLLKEILSIGEKMPITHYEHLGKDFLRFVFDIIENPPNCDANVSNEFLQLILAFNLQFDTCNDNLVVDTASELSTAKNFTESLLWLINREDNPINIDTYELEVNHSVLKIFVDLFSNEKTAYLFYTNDIKVLIDIIIIALTNSPIENSINRTSYIKLCHEIVKNTAYNEHNHRKDDLKHCLLNILDDSEVSEMEKNAIKHFMADSLNNIFSD